MNLIRIRSFSLLCAVALLTACTTLPVTPPPPPPPPPVQPVPPLTQVDWPDVDGWTQDNPAEALAAFLGGCEILGSRPRWSATCSAAASLDPADAAAVRTFFEQRFAPHQVRNPDGSDIGTITGYYIPELHGSRTRTDRYRFPLYAVPDDLLVIDLRSVYPDLANYRLRGRLVGRKVVPYYSRAELDADPELLEGKELFWVDDPVELFFMQIQGSGRILFEEGDPVMVHYADQNGHPYRSIGKLLLDLGAMPREQMSMQNIKAWARQNPDKVAALLAENPSYVFFTSLPGTPANPPGALGTPLTPGRSIAVDPRVIPLGAPVFLATTWPLKNQPLQRLMLAQDTGGAIRGAVRADFYWGLGAEAGEYAGKMKHKGRMWVLLPREETETAAARPQGDGPK